MVLPPRWNRCMYFFQCCVISNLIKTQEKRDIVVRFPRHYFCGATPPTESFISDSVSLTSTDHPQLGTNHGPFLWLH